MAMLAFAIWVCGFCVVGRLGPDLPPESSPPPASTDTPLGLAWRQARRIVVGLIGGTVLLIGIILIVTPGPAFVVIPAGLAILATEFVWARRWLRKARRRGADLVNQLKGSSAAQREEKYPPE